MEQGLSMERTLKQTLEIPTGCTGKKQESTGKNLTVCSVRKSDIFIHDFIFNTLLLNFIRIE